MSRMRTLGWIFAFIVITGTSYAQELPIAVGSDNVFSGGAAFDGTKYCAMILGDNLSMYSITAQFVSRSGSLDGPRISLGHTGNNPIIAFDGSNYLALWSDIFPRMAGGDTNGIGNIYGQFVSPSGTLVGTSFTRVTGVNIRFGQGRGGLTFQNTTYLLSYCKGGNHTDYLYGQRVSRSGSLVGGPFQISAGYAREADLDFDGTNYLVAWCKVDYPALDKDIYGQFVSPSGALVGTNFLIDGGGMPVMTRSPWYLTAQGTGCHFRNRQPTRRGAGTSLPVSSLRPVRSQAGSPSVTRQRLLHSPLLLLTALIISSHGWN